MNNTEIATIIKRFEGKGGKGTTAYWFTKYDPDDKTARINSIELGRINTFFLDMAKVGVTDIEACLSHPVCLWSKKTTFLNGLKEANISNKDAYDFIQGQKKATQLAIEEDRLELLTYFLIHLAPNRSPKALAEMLFTNMAIEYKKATIKKMEELELVNGRNEEGWINFEPSKQDEDNPEECYEDEQEVSFDEEPDTCSNQEEHENIEIGYVCAYCGFDPHDDNYQKKEEEGEDALKGIEEASASEIRTELERLQKRLKKIGA